jgi:hypothetical protein
MQFPLIEVDAAIERPPGNLQAALGWGNLGKQVIGKGSWVTGSCLYDTAHTLLCHSTVTDWGAPAPASREQITRRLIDNKTGYKSLRAGLPAGCRVGAKTAGGGNGTNNNIGVLWPPGRAPVLVTCYLTQSSADLGFRIGRLRRLGGWWWHWLLGLVADSGMGLRRTIFGVTAHTCSAVPNLRVLCRQPASSPIDNCANSYLFNSRSIKFSGFSSGFIRQTMSPSTAGRSNVFV